MVEKNNFGNIREYFDLRTRIFRVCKQLRSFKNDIKTSWEMPAEMHLRRATTRGKDSLTLTITLSPSGCEWARQGGCTMCGEFESFSQRDEISKDPRFHVHQFVAGLTNEEMWKVVDSTGLKVNRLRIYQEGNYSNSNETSRKAQLEILRLATLLEGIEKITIESRPQYVTEEVMKEYYEIFKNTNIELEIGMGLEAENDVVRNVCVNKQGTNSQFENAIKIMKKYNISPLAYIILKPPFLTEKESVIEAVATVEYANKLGFKRISLEPMSIHGYTLVDALKQQGLYDTPWLWSVIEVLKRCSDMPIKPGVGGIGFFPAPEEFARNKCGKCNKDVIDEIILYNKNKDVRIFNKLPLCDCFEEWKSFFEKQNIDSLAKRIDHQLKIVEDSIDDYRFKKPSTIVRDDRVIYEFTQYK